MKKLNILLITLLLAAGAFAQKEAPKAPCKGNDFHNLANIDKANVIRRQIVEGLATKELTPEQKALMLRVYDATTPEVYGGHVTDEIIQLQMEVEKAFTREQMKMFVYTPPLSSVSPIQCFCNQGSNFNVSCTGSCFAGACVLVDDGCGFIGVFACNGKCFQG